MVWEEFWYVICAAAVPRAARAVRKVGSILTVVVEV
jgi:hypothetical protein